MKKLKMHLSRPLVIGKSSVLCGQRAKRPLRTTNVQKMEDCKKCRNIRHANNSVR